jgi:hypothetical protein
MTTKCSTWYWYLILIVRGWVVVKGTALNTLREEDSRDGESRKKDRQSQGTFSWVDGRREKKPFIEKRLWGKEIPWNQRRDKLSTGLYHRTTTNIAKVYVLLHAEARGLELNVYGNSTSITFIMSPIVPGKGTKKVNVHLHDVWKGKPGGSWEGEWIDWCFIVVEGLSRIRGCCPGAQCI